MPHPLEKLPYPICSVDRARELGLDVGRVRTCHPERLNGIAGCPQWRSCRFNRAEYGGFKGTRPHLIAYYFRALDGSTKTDKAACHTFVAALQPQMDAGLARRQQGLTHQLVRIVAQEGQSFKERQWVTKKNEKGEHYSSPVMVDSIVPKYPDPAELMPTLEYENAIMAAYDDSVAEEVSVPRDPQEPQVDAGLSPLAKPVPRRKE